MEREPATGSGTWLRAFRRFFQPSYRQLTVLVVTATILAAGVVGLTSTTLAAAQRPIDRVDTRLLVASRVLQSTTGGVANASSQFAKILAMPAAERAVQTGALARATTQYQSDFTRYRAIAIGLPQEASLQRQFAKLQSTNSELGLQSLSESAPTAAQIEQTSAVSLDSVAVLSRLQALYNERITAAVDQASAAVTRARFELLVTALLAMSIVIVASLLVVRSLRRDSRRSASQSYRTELESSLHRALEMATTEQDVFGLVQDAVSTAEPDLGVELLVADSSRAHLRKVVNANMEPTSGCSVASPTECPATIHGQTQIFESSTMIDACPYLKHSTGPPCSAVCVPLSVAGRSMGVMRAIGEDRRSPAPASVSALELIARRAGERLSMLRAFARSEMQANTDPLTGLLNRRSLEAAAQELMESGESFVAAYADLDHFKVLNDVHGHDAGDRALRLFARVLRDSVRPSDIPARYGGEEFVVVLPSCGSGDAAIVMERVRSKLAAAIAEGAGPVFTVSVGVAESSVADTFSETVEAADSALLQAKATGRDRVVLAGSPDALVPDDPRSIVEDHAPPTAPILLPEPPR
jgi:diguanylate cyclase (GGDEF)-like protein